VDALLDRAEKVATEADYFTLTHLDDALMTEQEIRELPKVWVIGGDGALGDIGFQNVSKVVLQNRPNVKMLMLDTQVYSNTGGQNSDSSTMLGGYDMNQFGVASQGKLIEKKNVAEAFTSGHGSPFVAQVSMANAAKLYKAMLDGLEYRGTAFFQAYTTCQPEHGVGDNMSADQAKMVRDARGMPEFVYNPRRGETSQEAFDLKGNPSLDRDWWRVKSAGDAGEYNFTVAHWAVTEGRFRKHVKSVKEAEAAKLVPMDDMLCFITQDDVIHRRVFDPAHRSFVPNFGCSIRTEEHGQVKFYAVSRQMVLFAVERRKAWRMLQSKAGLANKDYLAQTPRRRAFLAKVDKGEIPLADARARVRELFVGRTGGREVPISPSNMSVSSPPHPPNARNSANPSSTAPTAPCTSRSPTASPAPPFTPVPRAASPYRAAPPASRSRRWRSAAVSPTRPRNRGRWATACLQRRSRPKSTPRSCWRPSPPPLPPPKATPPRSS
jgi:pyruvate-ferredoxin/flavodoxin oxidoreductase